MEAEPAVALPRERAVSSEPCASRPNPFDDNNGSASRKRQRTSRGGSRSRSADTATAMDTSPDSIPSVEEESPNPDRPPVPPQTPPGARPSISPERNSSKVTINLRTAPPLDAIPDSSPPSPTPLSRMPAAGLEARARQSIESDELSTIPAGESPSSSSLAAESPEIEVVTISEDAEEFDSRSPPLAIIDEDDLFVDPFLSFPYRTDGETLSGTVKRLVQYFQSEPMEENTPFCKLRDWIDSYLTYTEARPESWYGSYYNHRTFWNMFPDIIWALSSRSRFFGQFLERKREEHLALAHLFRQFARLAGRFVAMDLRTLSRHSSKPDGSETPDLPSRGYINALGYLFRKDEPNHIGKNLENHYAWNWDAELPLLTTYFQNGGGSLLNLTRLCEEEIKLVSRFPRTFDSLSEPCRLVYRAVQDATNGGRQTTEAARQDLVKGYGFFKAMSTCLVSIIEKHVSILVPDSAQTIVNSLTNTLYATLVYENDATRDLVAAKSDEHAGLPLKLVAKIMSLEWKFTILKKLITSAQMQLRVVGVTTMCGDLLHLHSLYKGNDPAQNPVLLYFADFMIQNKIMEYLVGVASHPEIINESYNILGFLIVTNTYKASLVSTIWQTMVDSQDPRVTEAILRMLHRCINLQRYEDLVYLCEKAISLPIDNFTATMRDFCDELLRVLMDKAANEGILRIDAPPYYLCMWLLRESSVMRNGLPTGYLDIQSFAFARFCDLARRGPTDRVREEIYAECVVDISSKAPSAAGSICVINGLLQSQLELDLRKLTVEHSLTSLIVDELEYAIAEDRFTGCPPTRPNPVTAARQEILLTIILKEPRTLTTELGTKLWDLLVGCKSKRIIDRITAWKVLNGAARRSSNDNTFIADCLKIHLPALPSECFTEGTLDFARTALYTWLDDVRDDIVHGDREFESPALEQLWRMILISPPNTIEGKATLALVQVYVERILLMSLPRAKARSIHLALVDRCLKQLASAADKLKLFDKQGVPSHEDTRMAEDASETEIQEQELMFARSLAVLRDFLKAYQSKPQFSTPRPKASTLGASNDVEGEPLTVKYQSFDGEKHTEVMTLTLGKLNTAASLVNRLQKATGFKNFKLYYGGKGFDPDEIEVTRSLEDLNLNGLVLVQKRDEDVSVTGTKTTLELEITTRMDELWGYLSMRDIVAQEIYSFLTKFPTYDALLADIECEDVSYKQVFPLGQPYKCLYAIHAIREYGKAHGKHGAVNEVALTRATKLIVSAISDPELLSQCPEGELRDNMALNLIDCLVLFLKEPIPPASVDTLLDDTVWKRLLEMLNAARSGVTSNNSVHLTWRSFEAIMEACIYNPDLWSSFRSHLATSPLLQDLLLNDPRPVIRKSIAKQILTKCTFNPTLARVSATDFAVALWPMLVDLIHKVREHPYQCEELFSLAQTLFKRLAETSLEFLNLDDVVRQWTSLLLYDHSPRGNSGHSDSFDMMTQGLANLCYIATSFAKASEQTLSCSDVGAKLFQKHLFPDLAEDEIDHEHAIVPRFPCLNTSIRHVIAETVFHLVKDDKEEYRNVLMLLSYLVPYEMTELGTTDTLQLQMCSDFLGPYVYELPYVFERSKSVRSPTGYIGLRNLSNTCYLNSLFTQLFMNIPFREFMLNSTVADPEGSQKLLSETQNLFSYMQNSLRKFIDPTNLAASIRTYEDTHIDVNIQMDVDEFYNLLFDRWESQILHPDAKKQFRSFYGGQLVQQVKSKECPHISERLEPFSAIQCDIKGKTSLQESLQAYVDGEILAGGEYHGIHPRLYANFKDNKYKCSTCDRHVDAVKRACLKGIPDNLIFHLKRFEFNLRMMQRSKINDYFSFPERIDMRPYTVEHLMDSPDESPEDIFELVGVLVHSGTAESGHYYSYIKERPSNGTSQPWIEFNDDTVTGWDPKHMDTACFGGMDHRASADAGNVQFDKNYSAYMLFYQRSSYLAAQKQELERSETVSPIRLPLSPRLSNHIAMENELILRKYCLYDPSHATFVNKMLLNIKNINKGCCSDAHNLEKSALVVALNHLDQVIARTKDLPDFANFILVLRQMCNNCAECSRDFLEWFCDRPECLRHLLLRSPETVVRNQMSALIIAALTKVKADAAYAYGLGQDDDSTAELDPYEEPQVLQKVVRATLKLFDMFHTNTRAWPEYFGLLLSIAGLGDHETVLLLDAGYLRRMLEIVCADPQAPISTQYQRMLNIISKRGPTRPVSYDCIIGLLHRLLSVCDLSADTCIDDEDRLSFSLCGGTVSLSNAELNLLSSLWGRSQVHTLTDKLLQINQNPVAIRNIIIALLHSRDELDHNIFQAIVRGIQRSSATLPAAPYLKAALTYCEYSEEQDAIINMVSCVTKVAAQIDSLEGNEFLQFYSDLLDLDGNKSNISPEAIFQIYMEHLPQWAPPLLNYYDGAVRDSMEGVLASYVLGYGPNVDFGTSHQASEKANMVIFTAQRLGMSCLEFLNNTYVNERVQAMRAYLPNILNVINTCATFYDEDADDEMTLRFFELKSLVIPALTKITVDEIEDEISEGGYGSSEPMDSMGDLCVGMSDDMDGGAAL